MKDKKTYLKIACALEAFYIVIGLTYDLFLTKFTDQVLADLFFIVASSFFLFIFYKESKKDIKELKNNKLKLTLISIWFFFNPIIPGVFGFLFLNSISDKKKVKLPVIEEKKKGIKDYLKALFLLLFFIFIMFVLPNFKFFTKVPAYLVYLTILISVILLYFKELKNNLLIFIKNYKVYIPFVLKRYLIMLGIMLLVGIPVILINKGEVSTNQAMLNEMFGKLPLRLFILTTLYAPLVEESVFRLSLSKFFKSKTLFIIISGFLFGSLHVIDKFTSITDLLFIFQYAALGICLAKAYSDSKNIFVSISMHFMQNFLAAVLILLLY